MINLFLGKVFIVDKFVEYKTKSGKLGDSYYDKVERGVKKYITYINVCANLNIGQMVH